MKADWAPTVADRGPPAIEFPPEVKNLPRRERELALILYRTGPSTAKGLESRLSRPLSNSALRAMLGRLCRKGILKRRRLTGSHHSGDRRIPYVYSPAITVGTVRERALRQLAQDYFDGSLELVARTLADTLVGRGPGSLRDTLDIAA